MDIKRIAPEEAKEMLDSGEHIYLDVRSTPDRSTPRAMTQTPVTTSCRRPDRRRSISTDASAVSGLFSTRPSQTTIVSAASTGSPRP